MKRRTIAAAAVAVYFLPTVVRWAGNRWIEAKR